MIYSESLFGVGAGVYGCTLRLTNFVSEALRLKSEFLYHDKMRLCSRDGEVARPGLFFGAQATLKPVSTLKGNLAFVGTT